MAPASSNLNNSTSPIIQRTTSQHATQKSFTGLGNLVKLLPSGTFFLFTFLNPILTNNGQCTTGNKHLASIFIAVCGLSSCFSWFTDSYIDSNGDTQYGIVTPKGLYPLTDENSNSVNLSKYSLRLGDFVHALLSMIVFALVALLDSNTVECFYPSFESEQKEMMMALPVVVGAVATSAFVIFPNKRHGIGYPPRQVATESRVIADQETGANV